MSKERIGLFLKGLSREDCCYSKGTVVKVSYDGVPQSEAENLLQEMGWKKHDKNSFCKAGFHDIAVRENDGTIVISCTI